MDAFVPDHHSETHKLAVSKSIAVHAGCRGIAARVMDLLKKHYRGPFSASLRCLGKNSSATENEFPGTTGIARWVCMKAKKNKQPKKDKFNPWQHGETT